jgi:hypothetical protein
MSNPRWLNGRAKAGPIRNFGRRAYLNGMSKACDFCFPTRAELRFRKRRIGFMKSNTTAIACASSATATAFD